MTLNGHTAQLSGIVPPMITPLNEAGDVDESAVKRLIEFMIQGGVGGIFILGTSGESPWLTASQRRVLLHAAVDAVAERVPLLVGALEPCTSRTLDALREAEDSGADIVVVGAPYYFQADERLILNHVEALAVHSKLPLMYYNIPSMTHNPLSAASIKQLLLLEQLIGVKDSTGDTEQFQNLLQLKSVRPDFLIFQGAERQGAQALQAGADGVVPGLGNLAPSLFAALFARAAAGEWAAAHQLQQQIDQLWELHSAGYWLVCLKYAAAVLGFGSGLTTGHGQLQNKDAQEEVQRLLNLHAHL